MGLSARGRDGLEAAAKEAERASSEALALSADVAREAEIEDAAASVEHEFGPTDVWINNAMTSVFAPFLAVRPEEFRRVTDDRAPRRGGYRLPKVRWTTRIVGFVSLLRVSDHGAREGFESAHDRRFALRVSRHRRSLTAAVLGAAAAVSARTPRSGSR